MRVKVFVRSEESTAHVGGVAALLEGDLAAWLANHPGVRVSETRRTSYRAPGTPPQWVIAVWYETEANGLGLPGA